MSRRTDRVRARISRDSSWLKFKRIAVFTPVPRRDGQTGEPVQRYSGIASNDVRIRAALGPLSRSRARTPTPRPARSHRDDDDDGREIQRGKGGGREREILTSGSVSHPPGSQNAPLLLLLLLPRLLLLLPPRSRPPPGPPVRRDVEQQPAVIVADRNGDGGDRGAPPEILPRSRRAELRSHWSRGGVSAGGNAARRGTAHLAGMRFLFLP